mmetsp:Transcript_45548/g.114773  ORF Transcript_45548/g.114773 Transcript_45548/m.114773 type:complete len:216 (-) Transcript_45548:112-759(-)
MPARKLLVSVLALRPPSMRHLAVAWNPQETWLRAAHGPLVALRAVAVALRSKVGGVGEVLRFRLEAVASCCRREETILATQKVAVVSPNRIELRILPSEANRVTLGIGAPLAVKFDHEKTVQILPLENASWGGRFPCALRCQVLLGEPIAYVAPCICRVLVADACHVRWCQPIDRQPLWRSRLTLGTVVETTPVVAESIANLGRAFRRIARWLHK